MQLFHQGCIKLPSPPPLYTPLYFIKKEMLCVRLHPQLLKKLFINNQDFFQKDLNCYVFATKFSHIRIMCINGKKISLHSTFWLLLTWDDVENLFEACLLQARVEQNLGRRQLTIFAKIINMLTFQKFLMLQMCFASFFSFLRSTLTKC